VKRSGKRFKTRHFGVNLLSNNLRRHRLGLIVQKRFWCAVSRNRIKRCLREWFRLHKHEIPMPGKDVVLIARPGAEKLSHIDMANELLAVFARQDGRSS
jgi:ribonuclease P protein component